MEFDPYKDCYHQEVQKVIAFAGTNLDYCTEAKAIALLDVCRRHLGDPHGLEVLDLGCGVGLTDQYLAPALGGLWGVDVSAECVAAAARRNPGVHYQAYEGDKLPYPDNRFDVVFAICVMHHVKPAAWRRFTDEMRRVTRPGGITAVFEHNPFNPLTRLAVFRCPFDADAVLLSRRHTARLFAQSGFDVIDGRYILFFPFRARVLQAIERRLGWLLLGGQYYVVGRVPRGSGQTCARGAA
jgi:SAM-dependent methyltransferase